MAGASCDYRLSLACHASFSWIRIGVRKPCGGLRAERSIVWLRVWGLRGCAHEDIEAQLAILFRLHRGHESLVSLMIDDPAACPFGLSTCPWSLRSADIAAGESESAQKGSACLTEEMRAPVRCPATIGLLGANGALFAVAHGRKATRSDAAADEEVDRRLRSPLT